MKHSSQSGGSSGKVLVGTSGWSYRHWAGRFYPPDVPQRGWLAFAAARFDSLEINSTFYRLPAEQTVRGWAAAAPAGFTYAVKASRWITHVRKLREPEAPLQKLLQNIAPLGAALGPVLVQLPPTTRRDEALLESFLAAAGEQDGLRLAVELRHESWFRPSVYRLLERHRAAFVISDLAGRLWPMVTTAGLVYVRLHGPHQAYAGSYSDDDLLCWLRRSQEWAAAGHEVRIYFDNDQDGYAAANALRLKEMLAANTPRE